MKNMNTNQKVIAGVIAVVLLGGAFYAGDVYGKGATSGRGAGRGVVSA